MKKLIVFIRSYSKYLLVFWVLSIATVSSIPHLPSPKIETGRVVLRLDYLIHFCEYASLTFLAFLVFIREDFIIRLKKYLIIILLLILFAIADEFHQKLIPGRTFNPKDVLSNLTGIIAGAIICYFLFRSLADEYRNNPQAFK